MSGTSVFAGTRVPFQALLDYREAGQTIGEFLVDLPTVSREQAIAALEQATGSTCWRYGASRPREQAIAALEQATDALLARACPA